MAEIFELELRGGAIEKHYRRMCPEVEQLPWGTLKLEDYGADQIRAARVGWTCASMQEYESTTIHARVLQDMLRARMPIDLTAMSTEFQREELTHAELAAKMAMELGGGAPIEHKTHKEARTSGTPEYRIAETALWAFAISETYAHAMLAAAFGKAQHPLLRGVRNILAKDEAAHGRFGWILLECLLPEMNEAEKTNLRTIAAKAIKGLHKRIDALEKQPSNYFGELSAIGFSSPEEYRAIALEAIDGQILPKLDQQALLA